MVSAKAVVTNSAGIHCRPSAKIVEEARDYPGTITVAHGNEATELGSVLELISLALEQGAEVSITVEGPDEERVCERFRELFETHFDFPDARSVGE
ncbi:HPr family phosphocarrier protein [Kiritimatiella glycovorans]|uniref:Phosphocarrier protein HPr n=1 Tax=Kiritimatiella glycovorans TaxID=1307763 RepID=A0A0G3EGQ6_9BACT|nr:HPr family phosphocarrier protein [Kiritimatiella glycovorans]AKJ63304.1 Phosphocarrier protein HPr [Kiritimatiella glycovorans]